MTADVNTVQHSPVHNDSGVHDPVAIASLGFWFYILSDLILFSVLFATFAMLRHNNADGPTGAELFNIRFVGVETLLLLLSSATCGLAMVGLQQKKIKICVIGLVVTFLLGLGFIVMEVSEFHTLVMEGHGPSRSAFLSAFFTLVGTHGAHVTAGLVWILVMIAQVLTQGISRPVASRMMRLSVFWHFLDVVWIGVFSLVYLVGVVA